VLVVVVIYGVQPSLVQYGLGKYMYTLTLKGTVSESEQPAHCSSGS